jgi:hypothetical protein
MSTNDALRTAIGAEYTNPVPTVGAFNADNHLVLLNAAKNPYSGAGIDRLVPAPATGSWYATQYGCLRGVDPSAIARQHSFPDAVLPRGVPETPAPFSKVCLEYRTAWPLGAAPAAAMVEVEASHPQFAFRPGGPGTVAQIDAESQLRRLDQPLTNCQAVLAGDAPLYRNTVAPPPPTNVPAGAQNAANPLAAIVRPGPADACRAEADRVASSMSGRWLNNPTRQDTMRMDRPFAPPGIGSGSPRPPTVAGKPFYA